MNTEARGSYTISLKFEIPQEKDPLDVIESITGALREQGAIPTGIHFNRVVSSDAMKIEPATLDESLQSLLEQLKRIGLDEAGKCIYTSTEVIELIPGFPTYRLQDWGLRKYINPERIPQGERSLRRYSLLDVIRTGLMWGHCKKEKMPPKAASQKANEELASLMESMNLTDALHPTS